MLIPRGLNEHDFFEQVVLPYIDANGGASVALGANNTIVLYSGPDSKILTRAGITVFNWDLAANQITRLDASVINTTDAANFLSSIDLKDYFKDVYTDKDDLDSAWLYVWGKTSALFCEGDFENAATAVCGADPTRIFRRFEQDALLRNKQIERINNRNIELFRDFDKLSQYETYRLICLTELLEAKKTAVKHNTPEAWESYRLRRKFFNAERELTLRAPSTLSAADKAKLKEDKKHILATHKISKIMSLPIPAPAPIAVPYMPIVGHIAHMGHGTA